MNHLMQFLPAPEELKAILLFILAIIPAALVHEVAHGYIAYRLGDPTAKLAGRLTLNPFKHIDLFSTVLLPVFLTIAHLPTLILFKPVPVTVANLHNPRRDSRYVALAGPLSNFLLAGLVIFVYGVFLQSLCPDFLYDYFKYFVLINLVLGVFNLIPIPPLDGSWILSSFLYGKALEWFDRVRTYFLIIFLVLIFTGIFNRLFTPVGNILEAIANVLLPLPH